MRMVCRSAISNLAQNDHIDSLAVFKNRIYASTANRTGSATGFRLYSSETGDSGDWFDVTFSADPGFGDPANENFKDLQVFNDHLCGGTWNESVGAQVWCSSDGTTWQIKNRSGFGDPKNIVIWSGTVFDGFLYSGVQNLGDDPDNSRDDVAIVYRTSTVAGVDDWERVFSWTIRQSPCHASG